MWCAILLLATVEVCVEAEITLTPCGADTVDGNSVRVAEVRRGQTSQLLCSGLAAGDTVQWRYQPDGGGADNSAGTCSPLTDPAGCFSGQAGQGFTPTRLSDSQSVMTLNLRVAGAEITAQGGSLGCRRSTDTSADTSVSNFCLMDVIVQAVGTCNVKFERVNADDWQATGSCTITAHSSRNRYRCHWYRRKDSSDAVHQSTVPYTGPSGVCRFHQSLPAAGRYIYQVAITPGDLTILAMFSGNNEISTPTAPTVSGCSSDIYIEENSPVICTCSTTGLGQPAGRLVWRRVGVSSPVKSGDFGNNRLVVPLTLLRGDHDVTHRCDANQNKTDVYGSPLNFKVGYKPEGLTFKLNSLPEVTVAENAIVTMICEANSRPVATMTVHKDGVTSLVSSGPSPQTLTLDPARCADTGTYVCSGSNQFGQPDSPVSGKVYVTCSPRSTSTDLPALNYRNESTSVTFDVTAYPAPRSPFTFAYLGPGGADQPSPPSNVTLVASCGLKDAALSHLFICVVIVVDMTSEEASGAYTVTISNSQGSQMYIFNITYNLATPPMAGQGGEARGGADTVTVALAVVLAVVVIALIVTTALVVWLCRRLRQANTGTPEPGNIKDTAVSHAVLQQELEEREAPAGPYEFGSHSNPAGPYDSLDMCGVGVRSEYSDIGSHGNSAGPSDSPRLPDVGVGSEYINVRSHGNSAGPNATVGFESPYEIPG